MKYILTFFISLILSFSKGQIVDSSMCAFPLDTVQENFCNQIPDTMSLGVWNTSCFSFTPSQSNIHFSFLNTTNLCGPGSAYNNLVINLWNKTCDTIVESSIISGPSWDLHVLLTPNEEYILCYSFKPKCTIYSICPVIYGSPLGVDWLYQRAYKSNNIIHVKWGTGFESNTKEFILQKVDIQKNQWFNVDSIPGEGNTSTETHYEILDFDILPINHYRIIEVDNNGKKNYSSMFTYLNGESNPQMCVYFNLLGQPISFNWLDLKPGYYIEKCSDESCHGIVKIY